MKIKKTIEADFDHSEKGLWDAIGLKKGEFEEIDTFLLNLKLAGIIETPEASKGVEKIMEEFNGTALIVALLMYGKYCVY